MSRARTVLLFLAVTVIFGTAFPAVKAGLAFFPPLVFVAVRNYFAAVLLLAYASVRIDYRVPRTRRDWAAVLAGGVFLIGGVGFGFVGQQFITSGVAAVIFSLSPIVTGLFAWGLLPEERLVGRDYLAILLGFVGVSIIVRPDPGALLDPTVVGKLLVFTAVAVVALGTVLVRRSRTPMPVPALTGWVMVVGATIQAGFAVAIGESLASVRITPLAVATLLYLGVVVAALGLVWYLVLMGAVGAVRANLVTYLTPVVSLLLGWAFLDEQIQALTLAGFAVIVVGFALLQRGDLYAELARYRALCR
ncbi:MULTISPECIES: DMT family transporter [Haloarcula]|uniref:DMT family transporter n=1 Tax=Haloarcula TaxID=2237 RepID=UPI0023EB9D06|nr:DMT family transporter [Halomicroarcula sp. XH51]